MPLLAYWYNKFDMGPKPIQDVAPPPRATGSPAEPASGPEIVGNIPVRAPAESASDGQEPQPSKDDDSSFIVPTTPISAAINKDKQKPKNKDSKPKPTLAIVVAVLATACLTGGAYLKFFSDRLS